MGLLRRWSAAAVVLLVVACLGGVKAQNSTVNTTAVDVCPTAKWRTLPFLAKPTDLAKITGLISNFTMPDLTSFLKTELVPKIGANAFFLVLAALFLIIYILWRVLRWCCVVMCCSESCDYKRRTRDPYKILFGGRMTANKVFMAIFGLTAMAFAFYGMSTVNKDVTLTAWDVVDDLGTFTANVSSQVDNLLNSIGNISTIIGDFQAIVRVDIDVPGFRTNLTAIKTFLDGLPPTGQLSTDVSALAAAIPQLSSRVATLTNETNNLNSAKTQLDAWMVVVADVGATFFTDMGTRASNIKTAADNVAAKANAPPPGNNDAQLGALRTQLTTPDTPAAMLTKLDNLDAALVGIGTMQNPATNPTANPFLKVKNAADAVVTLATQIKTTMIPSIATRLNTVNSLYLTGSPALNWTVGQLAYVNSTVLLLEGAMANATTKLNGAVDQINAFFGSSPTPSQMATQMTTAAAGIDTSSGTTLSNNMNTAGTNFQNLTPRFYAPDVTPYRTFIANIRTPMNNMATTAATLLTLITSSTTPVYDGTQATWDSIKSNAGTLSGQCASANTAANAAAPAAPNAPSNYRTTAAAWAGGAPNTGASTTLANNVQAAINGMPSLASATTQLASVNTQITSLGTPPSSVINDPLDALNAIWDAAITQGDQVKTQIGSTVSSFRGSTDSIKKNIVDNLAMAQRDYKPLTTQYDGYRYSGSVALYAVSVVLVVLLFCCSFVNYHFGATFLTLLLTVVTVLYLLLAFVIALIMVVLGDVCPATEDLILSFVPANMKALVQYVLYGTGGSVKAVLKNTNIMDVDAVLNQTMTSQTAVINSLTGSYTFRPGPAAVINRISTTVAGVNVGVKDLLEMASYESLSPIYAAVKSFLCCTLAETFGNTWVALTFAGVLCLFLIFVAWFYIGKIDSVARVDCCGCSLHTKSRYQPSVAPLNGAFGYEDVRTPTAADGQMVQVFVTRPGEAQNGKLMQVALPPV